MIKKFKMYENNINKHDEFKFLFSTVSCELCGWYGTADELIDTYDDASIENYIPQVCPICKVDDYLTDYYNDEIVENDKDFNMYVAYTQPKPGVNFKDFNKPMIYAKAAYPEFFISKKYNL